MTFRTSSGPSGTRPRRGAFDVRKASAGASMKGIVAWLIGIPIPIIIILYLTDVL